MDNQLSLLNENTPNAILIDKRWLQAMDGADRPYLVYKDERMRISKYIGWLERTDQSWMTASLIDYEEDMLSQGYSVPYIKSSTSTVRSSYQRLLASNSALQEIRNRCAAEAERRNPDASLSDKHALYESVREIIENNIDPRNSRIKLHKEQDTVDSKFIRLTGLQLTEMINMTSTNTLVGIRDRLVLSLLGGMGIREGELVELQVRDFLQTVGGEKCLHIRQGKGNKSRAVPYGEQAWILYVFRFWCDVAGLEINDTNETYVIKAVHNTGKHLLDGNITVRSIQNLVKKYKPDGLTVKAHDLRRTYARLSYLSGMGIEEIAQNMGHSNIETTRGYIGELDMGTRNPGKLFESPG
jgi:integrase